MPLISLNYSKIKFNKVSGRYVANDTISPFLEALSSQFLVTEIGKSVLGDSIKMISVGMGDNKILMWSQMHGNESTTTKAILDLLNFLKGNSKEAKDVLLNCTIQIIPILNPDGAKAYTRVNANKIDLNRDAQDRTQPESKVLRAVYDAFQPHFCFNLHDQRTIFSVGKTNRPATVSFLAPAFDEARSISESRGKSMQIIVAMNKMLQELIPNQVGRYDDGFNSNCVGDAFQMLNTPTILFESGHFPKDYERERTREYIFYSIYKAIQTIMNNKIDNHSQSDYYNIPENGKQFLDVIIKNSHLLKSEYKQNVSLGILFQEVLEGNKVSFVPKITKTGNLDHFFAHKRYNCLKKNDLESLRQSLALWKLVK